MIVERDEPDSIAVILECIEGGVSGSARAAIRPCCAMLPDTSITRMTLTACDAGPRNDLTRPCKSPSTTVTSSWRRSAIGLPAASSTSIRSVISPSWSPRASVGGEVRLVHEFDRRPIDFGAARRRVRCSATGTGPPDVAASTATQSPAAASNPTAMAERFTIGHSPDETWLGPSRTQ